MFDIENYLNENFKSRKYADESFGFFYKLKRRFRRFDRGTTDAHLIYNMYLTIENAFCSDFVDYMVETRFGMEDRLKFNACRKFSNRPYTGDYNRAFFERLETEYWKARRG